MKLSELFYELSHGQLSNLAMAATPGEILESDQPKIVIAANEALLKLYSRFVLSEKNLLLRTWEHITNYHFLKKFAESEYPASGEKFPYIIDLPKEPFKEDVIRVLSVYNRHGCQVPLNDEERPDSVFTPKVGMIQIPLASRCGSFSLTYQAKHVPITGSDMDQEIQIPDVLKNALLSYIAYRVYSNLNTDVSTAKAQEHMMIYESQCVEVEDKDLVLNTVSTTNTRFHKRGWV